MTLHQITAAIRAAQSEIVSQGSSSLGYIVWAQINGRSSRIISPPPHKSPRSVLPIPGCETHIVSDEGGLTNWLKSIYLLKATALSSTLSPQ